MVAFIRDKKEQNLFYKIKYAPHKIRRMLKINGFGVSHYICVKTGFLFLDVNKR